MTTNFENVKKNWIICILLWHYNNNINNFYLYIFSSKNYSWNTTYFY